MVYANWYANPETSVQWLRCSAAGYRMHDPLLPLNTQFQRSNC